MFPWQFFVLFFPSINGQAKDTPYECGAHGRFEYCIDGIPGCVVGCHCHPGYYFDTDSKVCEPNVKLTQDYRRHFIADPTRVQIPITPPTLEESTTSASVIDDKVDEITNDADELGDWLYNQFFKTIENQVINNTKDENIIQTRRSGSGPSFAKKPSRRAHKYWKARKKRKKKNKHFNDKLLRITEDDSLFDSSSGSTSDDSSDSSSSDSESDHRVRRVPKGKNHGHKKLLVVNKRARPPLPSFIFLPNMETPFFPPIGLPPPPLPMYPMVPVPPMMAPPFPYPYPGVPPHTHDDNDETTTNTVSSTESGATTRAVTNGATTATTSAMTTTDANGDEDENGENESAEVEENKENTDDENNTAKRLRSQAKHRGGTRQKVMKKLREKMKRKNKLQNFFANEYQGLEPPLLDIPQEFKPDPGLTPGVVPFKDNINREELPPGLRDINFKYLTQLIHRGNLNATKSNMNYRPGINKQENINAEQDAPNRRSYHDTLYLNDPFQGVRGKPMENNIVHNPIRNFANQVIAPDILNQPIRNNHNEPLLNPMFNRRINNQHGENRNNIYRQQITSVPNYPHIENNIERSKRIEETNDTYYSNLGRQIASMIRNIEGDREVDIEIEKSNQNPPSYPIFHGNNYGSRSLWERSVRSPFTYIKSFRREMDKLKKSNENLFSLENEVAFVASTKRTLSLQELENVISKIDRTRSRFIQINVSHKPSEISKTSFNVNLLPAHDRPHSNAVVMKLNTFPEHNPLHFNISGRRLNTEATLQPELRNILFNNFRSMMPEIVNNYSTVVEKNMANYIYTTRKPRVTKLPKPVLPYMNNLLNSRFIPHVHRNSKLMTQQPNSTILDHDIWKPIVQKNFNYYTSNINHFINEKKVIPIRYPLSNHYESFAQRDSPYFHRQIRHFGYFDK